MIKKSTFVLTVLSAQSVWAQGLLTTPAVPAPSMKTLGQMEPRIPVPMGPTTPIVGPHFTISQPGSYSLMGNVTVTSGHGIVINASDVTLDLNGFTLKSTGAGAPTAGSGSAILLGPGVSGVTIRHGRIRSGTVRTPSTVAGANLGAATFVRSGWYRGVEDTASSPAKDVQLQGLSISGCGEDGVFLNGSAHLSEIAAMRNAGIGLRIETGTISRCEAGYNGLSGIVGQNLTLTGVNCRANSAHGVLAAAGTVADAVCSGNGLDGINVAAGGVNGAVVTGNKNWGVSAKKVIGVNANDNNMAAVVTQGGITGDDISQSVAIGNKGIGILSVNGSVHTSIARNSTTGFSVSGCTLRDCTAYDMLGTGMTGNRVSLTNVASNDNAGNGFDLSQSTITTASCYSNTGTGLVMFTGTVTGVCASESSQYGIYASEAAVTACSSYSNIDVGIFAELGVLSHCLSVSNDGQIAGTAIRDNNLPQP
jgi:hypothetical protein